MERDRNVGTSAFWGGVLNLEDFEVVHQRHDAAEKVWHFTVVPTLAAGVCPGCGRLSTVRHQTRDRKRIHDLPIGESRVELTVRTFQYECPVCGAFCGGPPAYATSGISVCGLLMPSVSPDHKNPPERRRAESP